MQPQKIHLSDTIRRGSGGGEASRKEAAATWWSDSRTSKELTEEETSQAHVTAGMMQEAGQMTLDDRQQYYEDIGYWHPTTKEHEEGQGYTAEEERERARAGRRRNLGQRRLAADARTRTLANGRRQ